MIIFLLIFSCVAAGGLVGAAGLIWRSNGSLSSAFAFMLICISFEILFAIVAEQYFLNDTRSYSLIKLSGRVIEIGGIGFYLYCLSKSLSAGKSHVLTPPPLK